MKIYSKKYDFEDYTGGPSKIICLAFIPRSASNYLACKMRETKRLGYPLEYFSADKNIAQVIKKRTSPNGVFSYKWNADFIVRLKSDFTIFLDRHDHEAQARSFCIAEKTGDWLSLEKTDYQPPSVAIKSMVSRLSELRDRTLGMIDIDKEIYFEDLIAEPGKIISEVLKGIQL